jgi:hypothetical protein
MMIIFGTYIIECGSVVKKLGCPWKGKRKGRLVKEKE